MKIKIGFVTNSSSSNFLILLDKIPETLEELKDLLLPEDGWDDSFNAFTATPVLNKEGEIVKTKSGEVKYKNEKVPDEVILKFILGKMVAANPLTKAQLIDQLSSMSMHEEPFIGWYIEEVDVRMWELYEQHKLRWSDDKFIGWDPPLPEEVTSKFGNGPDAMWKYIDEEKKKILRPYVDLIFRLKRDKVIVSLSFDDWSSIGAIVESGYDKFGRIRSVFASVPHMKIGHH